MNALEEYMCEQATGCPSAGGFRAWAAEKGFQHCEVVDWTSSAGDWSFLVSRDGFEWFPMYQNNRWPRPGFERSVNEGESFFGTFEEACAEMTARYS